MARDFYINGESMVYVKGATDTPIASLTELGLADKPIRVRQIYNHRPMHVDTHGGEAGAPVDYQTFLFGMQIHMDLIHFDPAVLEACLNLSMGNKPSVTPLSIGQGGRGGTRMGGGVARFAPGNSYIGLNISSPVASRPWRFYYTFLANDPMDFPLGTEKSVVSLTWNAVVYTIDPWGGGVGSYGNAGENGRVYDRTLDS